MARLFIASTLIISTTLGYFTLTNGHDWGDDFAEYLLQARSIVQGDAREFIDYNRYTIQNTTTETLGPYAYPWGWPLCLAPVYYFAGFDLIALKCVNLLFFNLTLLCLYALFVRRLGQPMTCLLVAMLAFNPILLGFLDNLLSDATFMFFAVLSMYFIDKFVVRAEYLGNEFASYVLLGVSVFAAVLVRSNGILILPIISCCQVFETRFRAKLPAVHPPRSGVWRSLLLGATPYAVCLVLKLIADVFFPYDTANHGRGYHLSFPWVAKNLVLYPWQASKLFGESYQGEVLFVLSLPFLCRGIKTRWRQDCHFLTFCAANQLLYTVWPGYGGMRYVLFILPFYLYFIFQGASAYAAKLSATGEPGVHFSWRNMICGAAITLSLLVSSSGNAMRNMESERALAGPYDEASREMFDYVMGHTAPDAKLLFFKPRAMRLMTGRPAFGSFRPEDLPRADYFVFHKKFNPCNQIPYPESEPVDNIFENSNFVIYRVRPASAG